MALIQLKDIQPEPRKRHAFIYQHEAYNTIDLFDSYGLLEYFGLDPLPRDRETILIDESKLENCSALEIEIYIEFLKQAMGRQVWASLAELAKKHNVSRATAQRAIKNLEINDLIIKIWTTRLGSSYLVK
jgi:hypothetical protein